MNRTDVPGTFREMWETRPSRPQDDRQLAGVASAIARRYDIDPTLVRIAFVVAAFAGIGAALYIAGWFALPSEPSGPTAPAGRRGRRPILVVALVIAAIGTVSPMFGAHGHGGWVLPLLVAAGLLFLLHRGRGDRTGTTAFDGAPTTTTPTTTVPAGAPTVSLRKDGRPGGPDTMGATGTTGLPDAGTPVPPSWDPLGAAPFAWDLPEPAPPPAPAHRRRMPVTAVTLGLALLAGAVTLGVQLMTGRAGPAGLPVLFGVPLAVVGLGLVVGAFLHTGRGLIPFALLGSLLTWGALSAPMDGFGSGMGGMGRDIGGMGRDFAGMGGIGHLDATPLTPAQVLPVYQRTGGDVTLDLSRLDLAVPAGGDARPVTTAVSSGLGDIDVILSPDADVQFTGEAALGDITFDGQKVVGDPGARVTRTDTGTDEKLAGRLIVLDVHAGGGDVTVSRG